MGYHALYFLDNYQVDRIGIDKMKLKAHSMPQEYAKGLSNGSIVSIFDKLLYIYILLSENNGFAIVGQAYRTRGFRFVSL